MDDLNMAVANAYDSHMGVLAVTVCRKHGTTDKAAAPPEDYVSGGESTVIETNSLPQIP